MDRGMRGEIPGPRVEDAHHAELSAEGVGVQSQGLQGGRGGLKEPVVQAVRRRTGHGAEVLRERQGDEKVRDRQEACPRLVKPAAGRSVLTRGAMPVLTGMVALFAFSAVGTL